MMTSSTGSTGQTRTTSRTHYAEEVWDRLRTYAPADLRALRAETGQLGERAHYLAQADADRTIHPQEKQTITQKIIRTLLWHHLARDDNPTRWNDLDDDLRQEIAGISYERCVKVAFVVASEDATGDIDALCQRIADHYSEAVGKERIFERLANGFVEHREYDGSFDAFNVRQLIKREYRRLHGESDPGSPLQGPSLDERAAEHSEARPPVMA
jgi:hypothetical protein